MRKRNLVALSTATYLLVPAAALVGSASAVPAAAATNYHVKVTCTVPKSQPERQLASNSCFNYLPDGTQTYNARVTNDAGNPVAGVQVKWTDSSSSAHFRIANNPCTTNSNGVCSDELVESKPAKGKKIGVTATAGGSSAVGYLTFR